MADLDEFFVGKTWPKELVNKFLKKIRIIFWVQKKSEISKVQFLMHLQLLWLLS